VQHKRILNQKLNFTYLQEIQMKQIISTKTLAVIAALAVSASMSAASYAAADARVINSFNEGSEPNFLHSTTPAAEQNAPALVKSQEKVKVSAAPKTMTSGFFTKLDEEVLYRKPSTADAKALNSVNEGQMNVPYGQ
jgi:hypothetical protein